MPAWPLKERVEREEKSLCGRLLLEWGLKHFTRCFISKGFCFLKRSKWRRMESVSSRFCCEGRKKGLGLSENNSLGQKKNKYWNGSKMWQESWWQSGLSLRDGGRGWKCGISAKKTLPPPFPITHLAECGAVNNLRERFGAFCSSSLSRWWPRLWFTNKKKKRRRQCSPTMSGPFNSPNYPQPGSLILCDTIY